VTSVFPEGLKNPLPASVLPVSRCPDLYRQDYQKTSAKRQQNLKNVSRLIVC